MKEYRVACLVPCYKRLEYTKRCIETLEKNTKRRFTAFYVFDDGSNDGTAEFLENYKWRNLGTYFHFPLEGNIGLRNILITFIQYVHDLEKTYGYDIMGVIGNDCLVPKNWLNDILDVFDKSDVQVLSPNVFPSNAAYRYGKKVEGLPYMPSKIVGGLWFMYVNLTKGMEFQRHDVRGIKGAFNILKQIIIEKDPKIGWLPDVVVQDLGHWSGMHPEYIKSEEHMQYYQEIGRNTDMKKLFWYPLF